MSTEKSCQMWYNRFMFLIMLVIAAAVALCVLFGKKIHEVMPPAAFTVTLSVYVCALIMPLTVAVWICAGLVVVALTGILILRKKGKIPTDDAGFAARLITPQVVILFVVCFVFCMLMTDHKAFFYDDLSYWAIYTKNIFTIDKLPHLFENCSVSYKDYTPIIQIMQYIAMFGRDSFSESAMFRTNICLIYVLLLPLMRGIEDRTRPVGVRVSSIVLYVIFPHILTSQFYYRLGVDLFLALVFGYALIYIFDIDSIISGHNEEDAWLKLICIVTALSFLALIKSSGIVLCIFSIIILTVRRIADRRSRAFKPAVEIPVTAVFAFGSYLSWQLFLRYSWNNGYLSDRVISGVNGGGIALPPYAKEVTVNYIRHFFTYPLTRSDWGVTAFVLVAFVILVYILTRASHVLDGNTKIYNVLFASSMICFFLFCVAHLCMYLFVFDDWEAYGLLEYDRYITQYLGGLFYVFVCNLITAVAASVGSGSEDSRQNVTILAGLTIIFVALLPYRDMSTYMDLLNYHRQYELTYAETSKNASSEWNESDIAEMRLAHDGTQRLTVIANAWDETTQFLEYAAVPQPFDSIINVPAIEPGGIVSFMEDRLEQYVYVAKNAPESYEGDWSETGALTADGKPLKAGTLYELVKENDTKTLVPVNK